MKIGNFASKAFIRWFLEVRDRRKWRREQRLKRRDERRERRRKQRYSAVEVFMQRREAMKALGLGAFLATTAATPALAVDLVFTSYAFPATGAPTNRTMPDRLSDIFNAKDYGAVGNGSHDDTAAINAALTALWGTVTKGATLFFPPGNYLITPDGSGAGISITNPNMGSTANNGRIIGAAKFSTYINGNLPNGFIFNQEDNTNGPEEIAHLSLYNSSTVIGSGALLLNSSSAVLDNCNFQGMICVLMPFNIYNVSIDNCNLGGNSDGTTGYQGTFGITGYGCRVQGIRTASPFQCCLQFWGSNETIIENCGIENSNCAIGLGLQAGWASACTVASDILTVGGTLGTDPSHFPQFGVGSQLFMRGLSMQTWGTLLNSTSGVVTITQTHAQDGSLTGAGGTGTYRISTTATISSPVPVLAINNSSIAGVTLNCISTEACHCIYYLGNVAASTIQGCGGGSTPVECVDRFGVTGLTPICGFYISAVGATTLISCTPSAQSTQYGSFYFDPNANLTNLSFVSCLGSKGTDNVTTAIISNGSGGSGDILNVSVFTSGSSIGVGMLVTGTGVTAGTRITGNHLTDPTLTGTNTTGTYRVSNSMNLSSRTINVITGTDWLMPTATASKTGLSFINCGSANLPVGFVSDLNSLGRTFTCLPGEAGSNNNVTRVEGFDDFYIVDGAKSGGGTAAPGDAVQGGGTQHIKVYYNGTSWIRTG